jgi:hypothetical protein
MVAAGVVNRDIAKFLHVNDKTVRNYVSQLYRKLALRNRTQMAVYARHLGLAPRTDMQFLDGRNPAPQRSSDTRPSTIPPFKADVK